MLKISLIHKLNNMLRYGLINELGTGENIGFARVEFDELGIKSGWISLPCSGSKSVKSWVTFPINTQVAVLMHKDGEQGVIIGSTWSDTDSPPSFASDTVRGIEFPDGMKIYYDWNSHKLSVLSANEISIECTDLKIKGDVKVTGNISATEQVSAMTLIPASKVTLSNHIHAGAGSPPIPGI